MPHGEVLPRKGMGKSAEKKNRRRQGEKEGGKRETSLVGRDLNAWRPGPKRGAMKKTQNKLLLPVHPHSRERGSEFLENHDLVKR